MKFDEVITFKRNEFIDLMNAHHAPMASTGEILNASRPPAPSFDEFSAVNRQRAAEWHQGGEPWSLADWGNALAGEVGELCNVIKKIRRIETGTGGRASEQDRAELVAKAKKEVADVYLYLDLVMEQLDPHEPIHNAISNKFNETSVEHGFTERL